MGGKEKGVKAKDGFSKPEVTEDTNITQHTNTQALDDEAMRSLKRDVEEAKSSDPILVTIRGNAQGKRHIIRDDEMILGRSRQASIRILDPSVSGQHCQFFKEGEDVYIEDMNSNNGTLLNNEELTSKTKLNKEDMITIGTTVLKYVPAGELEILYHGNLLKAAYIDRLTGIYNRNYLSEALEAEFKRSKALDQSLSILICDVDNFKEINDSHGHPAGDFALREFAQMLAIELLRPNEIMGRYGGDEFVIILWKATIKAAQLLGEKIRDETASRDLLYEGNKLPFTVSVGVAGIRPEHKTVQDLLKSADTALYESKNKGRNCVSVGK